MAGGVVGGNYKLIYVSETISFLNFLSQLLFLISGIALGAFVVLRMPFIWFLGWFLVTMICYLLSFKLIWSKFDFSENRKNQIFPLIAILVGIFFAIVHA